MSVNSGQLTTMLDRFGVPVASVRPDDGSSHSGFVLPEASRAIADVAESLLQDLAGWTIRTTDESLASTLMSSGAGLVRDSLLMVRSLTDLPARPSGLEVVQLTGDPHRLVAAYTRAYPAGHPDHVATECDPTQAALTLATYLRGEVVGPFLADASFEALGDRGETIGAIIVSQMPADAEYEGSPWVTEIFVHPDHHGHGVGRALLTASLTALASTQATQLGLAVSVGNPAELLYRSLGFTERVRTWKFLIPG